jgi:tRNA-splicing ligase RtcB
MSRTQAAKHWKGRQLQDDLRRQGIIVKSYSSRGIAEEAPGAYKAVSAVAVAAERAGLPKRVARLEPHICVKG